MKITFKDVARPFQIREILELNCTWFRLESNNVIYQYIRSDPKGPRQHQGISKVECVDLQHGHLICLDKDEAAYPVEVELIVSNKKLT